MVVDDEPQIRNLLRKYLESERYTVDLADDGHEAWRKLANMDYDCILLDLKMPGMSGSELYQLITEISETLAKKIVFWGLKLNRKEGGFAMGPNIDWGADWPHVFSSENNLSYYAACYLLNQHLNNQERARIREAKAGIRNFLRKVTYKDKHKAIVGLNSDVTASDIIVLTILIF